MIEMNPFYAHQSAVGPVFDVATWSRGKTSFMALVAFLFGALAVTALIFAWQPTLLLQNPPEVLEDLHKETLKLADDTPWAAYGGSAVAAFIAWLALSAAIASAVDAVRGEYYFRVGPGGLSLRIPHGLDFSRLCLMFKRYEADLPMAELADWTIVQHKQLGSMSRNAGNVTAFLEVRFADGTKEAFNLDCFREPAHVIHSKIHDALQMVPAQLGTPDNAPFAEPQRQSTSDVESTFDKIQEALSKMIGDPSHDSAVIVTDPDNEKCVQFIVSNDAILLDLPEQALDSAERARATDYLRRSVEKAGSSQPSGFQVCAANVDDAARLALEIFDRVYQLRHDQPLNVERAALS